MYFANSAGEVGRLASTATDLVSRWFSASHDQVVYAGLDCEWTAPICSGYSPTSAHVALLSLAIRDADDNDCLLNKAKFVCVFIFTLWHTAVVGVMLFHLAPFNGASDLPLELQALLADDRVCFVGRNIKGDITRLRTMFGDNQVRVPAGLLTHTYMRENEKQ